jgi:hypothetical protein
MTREKQELSTADNMSGTDTTYISGHLRHLLKTHKGLTQQSFLRLSGRPQVEGTRSPIQLLRTFESAMDPDSYIEIGTGEFDPNKAVQMLLLYAWEHGHKFADIKELLLDTLQTFFMHQNHIRQLIIALTGNREKSRRQVTPQPPAVVRAKIRELLPNFSGHEIILYIISDYVAHVLSPLGLVYLDNAYVYRQRVDMTYPSYWELIDLVSAQDLLVTLQGISKVDTNAFAPYEKETKYIQPEGVARALAGPVHLALTRARSALDPKGVVDATLALLLRVWAPTLEQELRPSPTVLQHTTVTQCADNFALFLAAQEFASWAGSQVEDDIIFSRYDDLTMLHDVLPRFFKALVETGMFRLTPISDSIAHIGLRVARDTRERPQLAMLWENVTSPTQLTAYQPVPDSSDNTAIYLAQHDLVADRMMNALSNVAAAINIGSLVDSVFSSYQSIRPSDHIGNSTKFTLALPHLFSRFSRADIESLASAIRSGMPKRWSSTCDNACARASRVLRDVYATMMHFCVARANYVAIVRSRVSGPYAGIRLHLVFSANVEATEAVGPTPIQGGMIHTTEPLELLPYLKEVEPTNKISLEPPQLVKYERHKHIWAHKKASATLSYTARYEAQVLGFNFSASLTSSDLLGLTELSERIRFFVPEVSRSLVQTWVDWVLADDEYYDKLGAKADTESDLYHAATGLRLRNAIHVAQTLLNLGAGAIGREASAAILNRFIDSVYGTSRLDDASTFQIGTLKRSLQVWSGMQVLILLRLVSEEDVKRLLAHLKDTKALTYVLSSPDERKR